MVLSRFWSGFGGRSREIDDGFPGFLETLLIVFRNYNCAQEFRNLFYWPDINTF